MTSRRLTRVQQDVVDRLNDEWRLVWSPALWRLEKPGEPSRRVADVTVESLIARGFIGDSYRREFA